MKRLLPAVALALVLGACVQTPDTTQSYGNEMLPAANNRGNLANNMLPSAEVTAFQAVDRRLGYANARIEYDSNNCAVYQGTAPNGRLAQVPLRNASNRPICAR